MSFLKEENIYYIYCIFHLPEEVKGVFSLLGVINSIQSLYNKSIISIHTSSTQYWQPENWNEKGFTVLFLLLPSARSTHHSKEVPPWIPTDCPGCQPQMVAWVFFPECVSWTVLQNVFWVLDTSSTPISKFDMTIPAFQRKRRRKKSCSVSWHTCSIDSSAWPIHDRPSLLRFVSFTASWSGLCGFSTALKYALT